MPRGYAGSFILSYNDLHNMVSHCIGHPGLRFYDGPGGSTRSLNELSDRSAIIKTLRTLGSLCGKCLLRSSALHQTESLHNLSSLGGLCQLLEDLYRLCVAGQLRQCITKCYFASDAMPTSSLCIVPGRLGNTTLPFRITAHVSANSTRDIYYSTSG